MNFRTHCYRNVMFTMVCNTFGQCVCFAIAWNMAMGVQSAMLVLRSREVDHLAWNHIFLCADVFLDYISITKGCLFKNIQILKDAGLCLWGGNSILHPRRGLIAKPHHSTMQAELAQAGPAALPRNLNFLFLDTFSITFRLEKWVEPRYGEIWHCQPSLSRAQFGIGRAWSDGSFLWRWGGLGLSWAKQHNQTIIITIVSWKKCRNSQKHIARSNAAALQTPQPTLLQNIICVMFPRFAIPKFGKTQFTIMAMRIAKHETTISNVYAI